MRNPDGFIASPLTWGVGTRLFLAAFALVPLWVAVGWAIGWWGTP